MTNSPVDFWKHGRMLLHQQCWCWGRDIESPYGNLLLQSGFERFRPPQSGNGSSRYVLAIPGQPVISLWAFGVTISSPTEAAIYINRYCFVPRWIPEPDFSLETWSARTSEELAHNGLAPARQDGRVPRPSVPLLRGPCAFDGLRPPSTKHEIRTSKRLLKFGLQWLADYERQILANHGVRYRRDVLRNWHEPPVLPERVPDEWHRMSWHIPEPPLETYSKPGSGAALPSTPEQTPVAP